MFPLDILEIIALYLPRKYIVNFLLVHRPSVYFWHRRLNLDCPNWVDPLSLPLRELYYRYCRLKTGRAMYFKVQKLKQERNKTDVVYLDIDNWWQYRLSEIAKDGDLIRVRRDNDPARPFLRPERTDQYAIWYHRELHYCSVSQWNQLTLPSTINIFADFPINYWENLEIEISQVFISQEVVTDLMINGVNEEYVFFNGAKCKFILIHNKMPDRLWIVEIKGLKLLEYVLYH